jgi:hypothetical protein
LGVKTVRKEQVALRLKTAVALLVGSIPIMLILPFLLSHWKLPIKPLEYITNLMTPLLVVAFVFALINAVHVGWRAQKKQMTREELSKIEFWKVAVGFAVFIFLGSVLGMFGDLIEASARIQVKEFLVSVSGKETVLIDGQSAKDSQKVIDQLKDIRWMPGHRSHDTDRIDIRIVDGDKNMNIFIRRDSDVPTEYWVYYPYYKFTSKMEIGRINTDIFNDFKGK